jgi:hypothetical protein
MSTRNAAWSPGTTFDRSLDEPDTITEIRIPADSSGNDCPRTPCVTESTVCGDMGECDQTRQYRHKVPI